MSFLVEKNFINIKENKFDYQNKSVNKLYFNVLESLCKLIITFHTINSIQYKIILENLDNLKEVIMKNNFMEEDILNSFDFSITELNSMGKVNVIKSMKINSCIHWRICVSLLMTMVINL